MGQISFQELSGWSVPCGPSNGCPPVVVQQGCCPTTGRPLPYSGPRRRQEVSRPSTAVPGPDLTRIQPPRVKDPTWIQPPPAEIGVPARAPLVFVPSPTGVPIPQSTLISKGSGLSMPRQFVPAGGFVAPAATMVIKPGPELVATKTAQAAASMTRFTMPWKDMQTAGPRSGLDVAAIQNRARKQAVPGPQGGYLPSSTGGILAGLGDSRGYTDPLFMPKFLAAAALGIYAGNQLRAKKGSALKAGAALGLVALIAKQA